MTISEMAITALVASPSTIYLECEGKRYRDLVELVNEYGDRLIKSAQILSGGGIKIELEPREEFDLKALLDLPDTIDAGTIEASIDNCTPEELMLDDQPAFEPDGLLDGPPPAEEVLGANE